MVRVLVCVLVVLGRAANAQPSSPEARDATLTLVKRLPPSANTLGLVPRGEDYLAQATRTGGADALVMIDDALERALAPWKPLAGALGWTREEAIQALLGGTIILVGHVDPGVAGLGAWTIMATVTPETEARLTSRLALHPREVVAGRPVFSVENGRFVLALRPWQPLPGLDQQRRVQLFLAPADEPGLALFTQTIQSTGQDQPPPAGFVDPAPAITSLLGMPATPAAVLIREDPGDEATEAYRGWGTHRVLTFGGSAEVGRVALRLRDARLAGLREHVPALTEEALSPWWRGTGLSAMILDSGQIPADLRPWLLALIGGLPVPSGEVDGTARVTVWSLAPRADATAGLCARVALQAEPSAASATELDALMARIGGQIELLASGKSEGSWDLLTGWSALAPTAPRRVPLILPDRGYAALLAGHPCELAWSLHPELPEQAIGRGHSGWFVAQLGGPGDTAPEPPGNTAGKRLRWLCRGVIRMDELTKAIPAVMAMVTQRPLLALQMPRDDAQAVADSLAAVREVAWSTWLDPDQPDIAHGEMTITVDPQRAKSIQAGRRVRPRPESPAP